MKRYLVTIIMTFLLSAGFGLGVIAQSNKTTLSRLLPILVDVKQIIPIEAVIVDSVGMTITVPLTMTVNLQVRLDGSQLASAEVMTPTEPVIMTKEAIEVQQTTNDSTINGVRWTIESIDQLGTKMNLRDLDHLKFETRGEFVIIHVALENVGDKPVKIGEYGAYKDFNIELIDDSKRSFAPFEVGYMLEELCSSVEINPGIETPCKIPFEMAKGAKGLRLRISNENNREIELIIPEK